MFVCKSLMKEEKKNSKKGKGYKDRRGGGGGGGDVWPYLKDPASIYNG